MTPPCDLEHDCSTSTWHRHDFSDRSGSIRWSTDETHVAVQMLSAAFEDVDRQADAEDARDAFDALNAREPDPELW
jgi:hypothetical protein